MLILSAPVTFFKTVQNKMHWAAHGQTAAEVIHDRVDEAKPFMGLQTTRPGGIIRKEDVSIAKNYLSEAELEALNNLVEQYLIFAQGQAMRRVPMHMADWIEKLNGFLTLNDRDILPHAGRISHEMAQAKAEQYLNGNPKDPQMRFLKGVIQQQRGQAEEALATFTQLTQDYPELPEPYNNLAVIHAAQNQYDKARIALEMAVRTNPNYATAHENLGDVYARLAAQSYGKALQLDGGNTSAPAKLKAVNAMLTPPAKKVAR